MQPQAVDNNNFSHFLNEAGWGDATVTSLSADMGLRRYFLLERSGEQALLMDMSRAGIRESGLAEFVSVDAYLRSHSINAPEIYYADEESGLAVIEYLGGESFGDRVAQGDDRKAMYRIATDILLTFKNEATENTLSLPDIKNSIPMMKLQYFPKSYMPFASGKEYEPQWEKEFFEVFDLLFDNAKPCQKIFAHADFHLENLIWRDDQKPSYGLIDFQDAFWVEQPYDLVNLLEDARQTVPEDIKTEMRALYCEGMTEAEKEGFDDWYCILSAFFHCKVIGQIVYYYQEHGMNEYICHIPRLQNYLKENLKNPVLKPLKEFIEGHSISLDKPIGA